MVGYVQDLEQPAEGGEQHRFDAAGNFISAGKKLVNRKNPALRELTSLRTAIVAAWKAVTLPFVEDGVRLIRRNDIAGFHQRMTDFQHRLAEAAARLDENRETLLGKAREYLGSLFNANDYPNSLAELFAVSWDYPAIEPPGYLEQVAPEVYRQEQQRLAAKMEEAVRLTEEAFAGELLEMVTHLAERLKCGDDGKPRVFRDGAVTGLGEFIDRFKRLSVGSSTQLEEAVALAEELMTGVTPGELRHGGLIRTEIRRGMEEIAQELEKLTIAKPRRKIVRLKESHEPAHSA